MSEMLLLTSRQRYLLILPDTPTCSLHQHLSWFRLEVTTLPLLLEYLQTAETGSCLNPIHWELCSWMRKSRTRLNAAEEMGQLSVMLRVIDLKDCLIRIEMAVREVGRAGSCPFGSLEMEVLHPILLISLTTRPGLGLLPQQHISVQLRSCC